MPTRPAVFRPHGRAARKPWAPSQSAPKVERVRGRKGVRQRHDYLRQHPLCRPCEAQGYVTAAQEVDHVIPLAFGGTDDDANKQPICSACHREKTARESVRGRGGVVRI